MEYAPGGNNLESTDPYVPNEKSCDGSCSRGIACARKRVARAAAGVLAAERTVETRATAAVFMQAASPLQSPGVTP